MPERVKYPLTPQAKEVARALVAAWDAGKLEQTSNVYVSDHQVSIGRGEISLSSLKELQEYKLIRVDPTWVTLLQELRNAVENDFEVSDFFLTTSAVGTIVYGNLEVREGAIFQSGAAAIGDVHQTVEQLVDDLRSVLGEDMLRSETTLNAAIIELRSADEPTRRQKLGNVVQELGRSLGHGANTVTILQGLGLLAQFFG